MRRYSQSLHEEMEQQLKAIHAEFHDPIAYSGRAIKLLVTLLEKLKTFSLKHKFATVTEEIEFFRDIKPSFSARLIYYNDIYNIEVAKPMGLPKDIRRHYKSELAKLKSFFDDNSEFYSYYRAGSHELDDRYFVRGRFNLRPTLDSAYFQADRRFSTSHDYKVARLIANEMVSDYLARQLSQTGEAPARARRCPGLGGPLKGRAGRIGVRPACLRRLQQQRHRPQGNRRRLRRILRHQPGPVS